MYIKSEGHEFKIHSKQIFALPLKLLIDYIIIEYIGICMVEDTSL